MNVTHNIGSKGLVPALVIQRANLTLGSSVQGSKVGGEELASLGTRVEGSNLVVVGLTNSLAQGRVEVGPREDADAKIGILAVVVEGRVDSRVAEGNARVTFDLGNAGLLVAIRAGDDYVELVAPLALVVGIFSRDVATPEGNLDLGSGVGILATGTRLQSGFTLEVDVESYEMRLVGAARKCWEEGHTGATNDAVALGSSQSSVIRLNLGVGEVTIGAVASLKVDKGLLISAGSRSSFGGGLELVKGEECLSSVRGHSWSKAKTLRITSGTLLDERSTDKSIKLTLVQIGRVCNSLGCGRGKVVCSGGLRGTSSDSDNRWVWSRLESINVNFLTSHKRASRDESREGGQVSNGTHCEGSRSRRVED